MIKHQAPIRKAMLIIRFIGKLKSAYIFICIGLLFLSCKKEITYDSSVNNTTNYRIDKIKFSCSVDDKIISIAPNSVSGKFELNYVKSAGRFFTEPLLYITITEYSDSIQTYKNTIGGTLSISDLSENNEFVIEYEQHPHYPTNIFKVTKK